MIVKTKSKGKSLGILKPADQGDNQKRPAMLGSLKIQMHHLRDLVDYCHGKQIDEIDCPLAAWINGAPGDRYLTIEFQPPFRAKPKEDEWHGTGNQFLANLLEEQDEE